MAQTTRFALPYQTITDQPDGPDLGFGLATATEGWLGRAFPVVNAAARLALTNVPEGFLVRQRDDGSGWVYTDLATWQQIWATTLGSGGSGTSTFDVASYSATSAQTFAASGTEYPVAFPSGSDSASVVRSTKGVGHKFTCAPGLYLVDATLRFAAGSPGSRFMGLRGDDDVANYASDQNDGGPAAATRTFGKAVRFATSTAVYIVASQSSGGSLASIVTGTQSPTAFVQATFTRLG